MKWIFGIWAIWFIGCVYIGSMFDHFNIAFTLPSYIMFGMFGMLWKTICDWLNLLSNKLDIWLLENTSYWNQNV